MALQPYTEPILGNTATRYFGNAAPGASEADIYFKVGDEVINTEPAGGEYYGWKCVTAGPGGAAVFKGFGAIAS